MAGVQNIHRGKSAGIVFVCQNPPLQDSRRHCRAEEAAAEFPEKQVDAGAPFFCRDVSVRGGRIELA
jgi:hypothetical protein